MSPFLRIYQHLLPTGQAWRLSFNKQIQKFFDGLTGLPTDARTYVDGIWGDAFPATTRELGAWEQQFGLEQGADDAARRLQIATTWKSQGGQSVDYLQGVLQSAGFPVYVHEWFKPLAPFHQACAGDTLARCGEPTAECRDRVQPNRYAYDPRNYTAQPLIGTVQCRTSTTVLGSGDPLDRCGESAAQCGNNINPSGVSHAVCGDTAAQCNAFLVNEIGYLVNQDLTQSAPPAVPSDPRRWPYFLYIGGAAFPTHASVLPSRRAELERLILKLRPSQQWVVMLVDYALPLTDSLGTQLVNDFGQGLVTG